MLANTFKSTVLAVFFLLVQTLQASLWIEESELMSCCDANTGSKQKVFVLKSGKFYEEGLIEDIHSANIWITDVSENTLALTPQAKQTLQNKFSFPMPHKGNYRIHLMHQYVDNDILYVGLTFMRVYNREGDINASLVKEVRGKTWSQKYDRPPLEQFPFELTPLEPIKKHHVGCCLYSGDILRFKAYLHQKPIKNYIVKAYTSSGWSMDITPDEEGIAFFMVPKTLFSEQGAKLSKSEKILVEASCNEDISGTYDGQKYNQISYQMSMPFSFGASPLEYTSKLSGFGVSIAMMLALSLGVFYYRRQKKKTSKEVWFEED